MSDMSQGPGWWVASDGKWYAPHLHPSVRADQPAEQSGPPSLAAAVDAPPSAVPVGADAQARSSWFGRHSKAALPVIGVVLCLTAAVPTAIALSGGSSGPVASSPAGHRPARGEATTSPSSPSTPTSSSPTSSTSTSATSTTVAPPPGVGSPPLTAATAQEVFDSSWPPFAEAFATGDTAGVAAYADTDVQEAIAGWFDCGCGPWPTAYQQVFMSAPRETSYPLSFLAEVQGRAYSQQPMVIEAVFTKEDAGAPWLITYLVSFVDGSAYLTRNTMATPAPTFTFDVSIVGGQLASFFQTVFATGKPPSGSWPQTGSIAQETERIQSSRSSLKTDHFQETLVYRAGPHSVAFAIPGGAFMCGEIRSHSVLTSSIGQPLVQPSTRSTFGQELPPGSYSSVTSDTMRDACWTVTSTGAGAGTATPVSFLGGAYSRVGAATTP